MSEEGFFRRWARLKSTGLEDEPGTAHAPAQQAVPGAGSPIQHGAPAVRPGSNPAAAEEPQAQARALPTLEDAARLTPDADFSAFVGKGVDKSVQRLALKTLFADPHFNLIDGLDVYMNDYNKASPLTPVMLASLQHAQGLVARLLDDQRKDAEEGAAADTAAPPTTEQGTA